MNMSGRPDMVQGIEILDADHFFEDSLAQYSFHYVSSRDAFGYSHSVKGEVFADALVVHGGPEIPLPETESYKGDIMARRLVAAALFGYEMHGDTVDDNQLMIDAF